MTDNHLDGHPLWRYACALYDAPGVAEACLAAQDRHGLNVNLALWACWLGAAGVALTPERVAQAHRTIAAWHDEVVALRAVRRRLKRPQAGVAEAWRETVRAQVQSAELAAEQVELAMLAGVQSATAGTGRPCAPANLALCVPGEALAGLAPLLRAAGEPGAPAVL